MKLMQDAIYSLFTILWVNAIQISIVGSLWVLNVAIREFTGVDVVEWLKNNLRKGN